MKVVICLHKVHMGPCLSRAAALQRVPQGSKLIPPADAALSANSPCDYHSRGREYMGTHTRSPVLWLQGHMVLPNYRGV